MKKLFLISLVHLLGTPTLLAQNIECSPTLKSSYETPSGWNLKRDTLELTFIGSSLIQGEFTCYYGVGRVALTKKVPSAKCKLKNSHKNPLGIDQGKVCNGMASDCSLICPGS